MSFSKKTSCLKTAVACGLTFLTSPAFAQVTTLSSSYTIYGTPGLIAMPTAEAAEDGELSFTYSQYGANANGTLSFQFAPRISGSFRYAQLSDFHPVVGDYFDRSFDLRLRVLNEGKYLPAVSVGLRDFIGTGIYSSEYIVATKSIGKRLRVTGGLGWGRMASHNPIGTIGSERPAWNFGLGGTVNFGQWFRGDVAPFAGVSFKATDKVTLKAEYSSDAFVDEVAAGIIEYKSPYNFGIDYAISPAIHLNAFYLAGDTVGASIVLRLNPANPASKTGYEGAPFSVKPRPSRSDAAAWGTEWIKDPTNDSAIRKSVAKALNKDGIKLQSFALGTQRVELKIDNSRYSSQGQAIGRTARVLTHVLPPSVETFVVTLVDRGIPLSAVTVKRRDVERFEHAPASEIFSKITVAEATPQGVRNSELVGDNKPFRWSLAPYMSLSFFDPASPLRAEVGMALSGSYQLAPNVVVSGAIRQSLVSGNDTVPSTSTSDVPRVRTDGALYAAASGPTLSRLQVDWYGRPGKNLYSRMSVGYFETMYGGVAGELLWKPVDSNFAIGAELAWVQKRDFDQLFGFQDYSTLTGHVSGYYKFKNGYSARVDVGRYLAGDIGATLAVARTFANGWEIGAYATKTNMSAEDFGEGSFDKGISISLPLDWALGTPSRNSSSAVLRSLQRDGGARVTLDGRLYDWVEEGHESAIEARWGKFWR